MNASIEKWRYGAAVRLPKELLDATSLRIGDTVSISQQDGVIVIERARPKLDELLAQITPENRHSEASANPIARELI